MHLARLAVDHLRSTPGRWITDEDARVAAAAAAARRRALPVFPCHRRARSADPSPRGSRPAPDRGRDRPDPGTGLGRRSGSRRRHRRPARPRLPPADTALARLLSGPLDVDKLDYLPRDARACNVPYGGVDTARLIDSLTIVGIRTTTPPADRRRRKGVSPLHSLINARQEMFDNVYWHHTNRACMAMLLRAIQEAVLAGACGRRPDRA